MNATFIIYAETDSLLEKIHKCDNNPEESSTTKISKHTACDHSLFTHSEFDNSINKHHFLQRCWLPEKVLCWSKTYLTEITDYEKKEMLSLTDEETESYNSQKFCHNCKKKLPDIDASNDDYDYDSNDDNDYTKLVIRTSVCNS